MGQKEKARRLLARYLRQKSSAEENRQVDRWYENYSQRPAEMDADKRRQIHADIFRNVFDRVDAKPQPIIYRLLKPALQAAAVLLLVSTITFILLKVGKNSDVALAHHIITTGAAEKKRVLLADGTEIWLNPATTLTYSGNLSSGDRQVELSGGSAFFKVHHDTSRPFRVKMPEQLYTQVLGTSFLISAPGKAADIQVTVKSGKVAVGKGKKVFGLFTAGQQLTYHPGGAVENGTVKPVIKTLAFDHTTLAELAARLEWIYYVHINIPKDSKISSLQCTGTFDNKQDISEILQTVCLLHQLKLTRHPDQQTFNITK